MQVFKYETPGDHTFTWPAGETEAIVIVQGPGGRSGTASIGEGGGGGGAWGMAVIQKTHATAAIKVGSGAVPGGPTGGPSSFKQGTATTFPGYFSAGAGANGSGRSGGAGGFPPGGAGVVSYAGGAGGTSPNATGQGGSGGGAAGCRLGIGGAGGSNSGANGGAGGQSARFGPKGDGGAGGNVGQNGQDGVWPGGGAGGGGEGGNSGTGAGGYVHVIVPPPLPGTGIGMGPVRCCYCFVEGLGMPETLTVEFEAPEVDSDEGIPSPQCHSTLSGFYGGGTEDLYCPEGGDTYDGETFLGCRPKSTVKYETQGMAFPNCVEEAYYSGTFCPNPEGAIDGYPSFPINISAQYLAGATAPLQSMSPVVLELVTEAESTPLAIPGGLTPIGGFGSCCDLVYATRGPADVWSGGSLVPAPYHKTLGTLPLPSWDWEQPAYSESGGHNCQGTQFPFPGDPPWAISMPNKYAWRQTTHTVGVAVLKLRLCVDGSYIARFMVSMSSGFEREWDANTASPPGPTNNKGMTLTYTLNYQDSGTITGDWTFAKVKEIVMDMQTSPRNSMFSFTIAPRSNFTQQLGNLMVATNEDTGTVVGAGVVFAPHECTGECEPPGAFPFLGYYNVYSATAPAGGFTYYYWATAPGTAQVV